MEAILPLLAKLGIWILDLAIARHKENQELRAAFVKFVELVRLHGLANVKTRLDAEAQIDAANKEWEKRNAEPKRETDGNPNQT